MRILIRTSKWAIWSRRIGSFALPLTVLPILLHRARLIDSLAFEVAEVAAIAVSLFAIILAIGALGRLWFSGDRGWGRAISGGFLGLVCLLPVGYLLVQGVRYPTMEDVSTDLADPPVLVSGLLPPPPTAEASAGIGAAYPNVHTRTYPVGAQQVFELVDGLAAGRGWDVRLRRAPQSAVDEGQLNAIALTLFGWPDEVSIRVRGGAEASSVDMRSASLSAIHDPGSNGGRVESFLLDLDAAVTVMLRDTPGAAQPEGEEPAAPQG